MEIRAEDAVKMLQDMGRQMKLHMKVEQENKIKNYRYLNQTVKKGQILFTGSSLMEQFPVCELSSACGLDRLVYNRGVGGYTTDDFLREIDTVLFELEPSKVFINIGTNDLREREDGLDWMTHLLDNYEAILKLCRERLPQAEIYLMAYYPVNEEQPGNNPLASEMLKVRTNENIALVNERISRMAEAYGYHFINVNQGLTDEKGNLKAEFTVEGIHMFAEAYGIVFDNLKRYILK